MTNTDTNQQDGIDHVQQEISDFALKFGKSKREQEALADWHINLFEASGGKIDLPWSHDRTSMYCTKYYEGKYDTEDGKWAEDAQWIQEMNVEATLAYLKLVVKTARSVVKHLLVEKKYTETDFKVKFTLPIITPAGMDDEEVEILYSANREAVCKKIVVGTKHIEEQVIPAHDEEIVEWECEPVSLLGFTPDSE